MPSSNPRINVTLSPSLDALVARLASLQRVSKSSVLRELLEAAEPQLSQVAALMDAASNARLDVNKALATDMQSALHKVVRDAERVLARGSGLVDDLVVKAEAVRGRRPARMPVAREGGGTGRGSRNVAGRGRDPLLSKRGVKS